MIHVSLPVPWLFLLYILLEILFIMSILKSKYYYPAWFEYSKKLLETGRVINLYA
jgi:hypothetical protein